MKGSSYDTNDKNIDVSQMSSVLARRYRKGYTKEARVCPQDTIDGVGEQRLRQNNFREEAYRKEMGRFPNMKIIGNRDTQSYGLWKLPESTTCVKVTTNVPKACLVTGGEIFRELSGIMKLQKLGHLMEQGLLNCHNVLQELNAAGDDDAVTKNSKPTGRSDRVSSQVPAGGQVDGQSTDGAEKSTDYGAGSRGQTATGRNGAAPGSRRDQDAGLWNRDALLVLRAEALLPELRELPADESLLTVPSTLTEATRMIFELRKDLLALRNSVLKQALAKAEERIAARRKLHKDKDQRLLKQLSKLFSSAQLAFWRDGGRTEPWTPEDYLHSISLRQLCTRRAFLYVTNKMKVPLPSMHAVRSMASCGLLPEVTERYQEMVKTRELFLSRLAASKKAGRSPEGEKNGGTSRSSGRADRDGHRVKKGTKRKRQPEAPPPPASRRPCWGARALPAKEECDTSEDECWSEQVRRESAGSPGRPRATRRKKARAGGGRGLRGTRPHADDQRTGAKLGLWDAAESPTRGDMGSSEEEWGRTDDAGVWRPRAARGGRHPDGLSASSRRAGWPSAHRSMER